MDLKEKEREREQIKCESNFWDEKEENDLSELGQRGICGLPESQLENCICVAENLAFDETIFKI